MGDTRELGRRGEEHAAQYLSGLGWEVLARNWRCPRGELDIIARDPLARTLVFCEVKCRSGLGYGDPLEAVTRAKQAKLRELAQLWLRANGPYAGPVRIDVLGVVLRRGFAPRLTHVRGIA